jgi:hypothetical protein
MIRASDFANAAIWPRPAAPMPRADASERSTWFDATASEARVSGDLNPAARGLSVAQHASLVLAHLRGE